MTGTRIALALVSLNLNEMAILASRVGSSVGREVWLILIDLCISGCPEVPESKFPDIFNWLHEKNPCPSDMIDLWFKTMLSFERYLSARPQACVRRLGTVIQFLRGIGCQLSSETLTSAILCGVETPTLEFLVESGCPLSDGADILAASLARAPDKRAHFCTCFETPYSRFLEIHDFLVKIGYQMKDKARLYLRSGMENMVEETHPSEFPLPQIANSFSSPEFVFAIPIPRPSPSARYKPPDDEPMLFDGPDRIDLVGRSLDRWL